MASGLHKTIVHYLALFLISTVATSSSPTSIYIDYMENTELIQKKAGYDIKLECNLKGLVDKGKLENAKIHWYFKQCGENSSGSSNCFDFYEDDWTELPCVENFCKADLLLHNVTEKYSGLYKCTVYPYRLNTGPSLDIQLVRTYHLDVKNASMPIPEFLDSYPLNKSVTVGAQVVFQCRIYSEGHPIIKWFRRVPEFSNEYGIENYNAHIVKYNGRIYELLPSAREKAINDEIYLSKLILNGVRLQDEGYYACVAITYRGHRIREAYLQVNANEDEPEYWMDYDEPEDRVSEPREFWMLFLMPLGLAMLPVTVWLGYLSYKKCKSIGNNQNEDDMYSEKEMAVRQMLRS